MPRFLVVDDDAASVKGMTWLLADDGHSVSPFTTGAEAVRALARGLFDVVVTDLEMPLVDGREVVRAIREHQPNACVVVVTERAPEHCVDLVKAGACLVVQKPIDYEEVAKAIEACRGRNANVSDCRCHMRWRAEEELVALHRK